MQFGCMQKYVLNQPELLAAAAIRELVDGLNLWTVLAIFSIQSALPCHMR